MDSVQNKIIIKGANLSMLERNQGNMVSKGGRPNHQDCHYRVDHLDSNEVTRATHTRQATEEFPQKRTVCATQYRGKMLDFSESTSVFKSWLGLSFVLRPLVPPLCDGVIISISQSGW